MTPPATSNPYKRHRFPGEIISHAVWLYYRFSLSHRDVEELLFERGIIVSYEAIRKWCRKFGQDYANQLRRRRPRPGDKWHLDEMVLTINGEHHYLWRAVDQDGNVLDILVQSRRNMKAAKKFFFRKLLKGLTYVPRVVITDQLKSYGAAKREILPGGEHRQSRYLNNWCGTRICRRVSVNGACNGSSPPATLNAFSPPTVPLPSISDLAVTCFERVSTAKRWHTASRFGKTSREQRPLKGQQW